jgi:hypothetical protein
MAVSNAYKKANTDSERREWALLGSLVWMMSVLFHETQSS